MNRRGHQPRAPRNPVQRRHRFQRKVADVDAKLQSRRCDYCAVRLGSDGGLSLTPLVGR